jgi:leucine zipper transcription factor-like protein 1
MAELSDAHKNELARFSQFFKNKRELHVRHMQLLMGELGEDRITEEILQKGEVQAIFADAQEQVAAHVREILDSQSLQAMAHIATLLSFAQASGVELEADVHHVEDSARCAMVAEVANSIAAPRPAPNAGRLPQLGAVGGGMVGSQEMRDLQEENRKYVDRFQQMQKQVTELLKERSMLSDELEGVKSTFKQLKDQLAAGQGFDAGSMETALQNARAQLDAKNREIENISGELNNHIGSSSQFRDMRSMMAKKNQQLKELRSRLAQYEQLDDAPVELED